MFKLIVAGSRGFNDYDFLKEKLDYLLNDIKHNHEIEFVSGDAYGADKLGERYAKENNYKVTYFKPDWSVGKSAGYIRNNEMAKYVSPDGGCVVFWKNKSKGSKHMIDLAKIYNLKLRVYDIQ